MRALTTLLGKELREQRLPLAIVFGLGILGALTAGLLVDTWLLDSEILARVLTFAFGGLAALTLGCDIGARERGEGSLAWTLRQPFGLGTAVASKALVLVGATLGGIGLGYAVSRLVTHLFGSGLGDLQGTPGELIAVGCVVAAGLWCAAASSFLPRGFLAAPGGLVVWLLCSAPAWVPIVWWELRPDAGLLAALAFALLAGGLCAFVVGQTAWVRRTDSQVLRALLVLGAGMFGCVPLWVDAAVRTHAALHFDPRSDQATIASAWTAEDGRHVHLTVDTGERDWRRRPIGYFPLVLDTATGALRQVGPAGHGLSPASAAGTVDGRISGSLLVDLEGAVVDGLDASGRRIAVDALVERGVDPGFAPPDGWRLAGRAGLGWALASDREGLGRFVGPDGGDELDREAALALVDGARGLRAWWTVDGWIVSIVDPGGAAHGFGRGPEGWEPLPWIGPDERLVAVLPDGTPLVAATDAVGPLFEVDPPSGARRAVTTADGAPVRAEWDAPRPVDRATPWFHVVGRLPAAADGGPRAAVAVFEFDSADPAPGAPRTVRFGGPSAAVGRWDLVGRLGDGSYLELASDGLWRTRYDGSPGERLFPPAD